MLIPYDPDAWVTVAERTVCLHHQRYPGSNYAGCTCGGSFGLRPATTEERLSARRKRLTARREELAAELASIEAELGATPTPTQTDE